MSTHMKINKVFAVLFLVLLFGVVSPFAIGAMQSDGDAAPIPELAFFAPLLDKNFNGEALGDFNNIAEGDMTRWEVILAGRAIQHTHALVDGSYGGRTLFYVNAATGEIEFRYVSTRGFSTSGSGQVVDGVLMLEADVDGNQNVQRVRSELEILANGRYENRAYYMSGDEWQNGHGYRYRPDPDARIHFDFGEDS